MGCGSSRSVSTVAPSNCGAKDVPHKNSRFSISTLDKNNNIINVSPPGNSLTNVNDGLIEKRREISASSSRTADSGIISELEEDGEILTEDSNPNKFIHVQASKRPRTPDLVLEGQACPRIQSGKEKRRVELEKKNSESSVAKLPPLGDGGLLPRPKTREAIAFHITLCPETGNIKKPPANLPKLQRRKKGKKLTREELDEKMRKATERRQEHNKKIVEKSQAFLAQYGNAGHTKKQVDKPNETSLKDDVENLETSQGSTGKDESYQERSKIEL